MTRSCKKHWKGHLNGPFTPKSRSYILTICFHTYYFTFLFFLLRQQPFDQKIANEILWAFLVSFYFTQIPTLDVYYNEIGLQRAQDLTNALQQNKVTWPVPLFSLFNHLHTNPTDIRHTARQLQGNLFTKSTRSRQYSASKQSNMTSTTFFLIQPCTHYFYRHSSHCISRIIKSVHKEHNI
jgi:hypothetical protein